MLTYGLNETSLLYHIVFVGTVMCRTGRVVMP